ncbi:MAG TPA: patatin-like phospholipase family protein [Pyrinomonadaceae bacterium]|nr:patatin-like phospholipase family protein [Pyrinomonadaceae bacterium]
MPEKKTDQIITFYSYKGGTGRSMTLANVAWILACAGKKVLAIDWDLEAPGLHRYFYPFLIDKELTASDGLIDFVINYALEAVSPSRESDSDPQWYKAHANILRSALSLNYEFPNQGRLDFVPAGRQGLSYDTRVNSFDWQGFYERLGGGLFLEEVKRQMREQYDYILIDSRTGVSDTSGICTIQMPDIIVPCFTLNHQGMDGALRITKAVFEKRKESGLKVFPVPMRLDKAENDKLRRRTQMAKDKFFPFPNHLPKGEWEKYWDDVPVFYVPYYSYEEVLAIFAEGRTPASIFTAAEKLTKYLVNSNDELVARETLPSLEASEEVLAQYADEIITIDREAELNQVAENAIARLSPEDRITARRVVQRLVKLGPSEQAGGTARQSLQLEDFPLGERRIIQELRSSRLLRLDTDSVTNKETVRLAEDEYLHAWQRLQQWLQEDRKFLVWLANFSAAHQNWQRASFTAPATGGSSPDPTDLLLKGEDLTQALDWLKKRYIDIHPRERNFIEMSRQKAAPTTPESVSQEPKQHFTIPARNSDNVSRAQHILRGRQAEPREMLELAKKLKGETRFSYARRLLARASAHESIARDKKLRETIFQQLALCTYKDQDLPADERLDRALGLLNQVADFDTTTDQETLGLIGSIFKRKWEIDNQRQNLERSLFYYLRGYEQGVAKDQGYTGINAAFVLDRLASLEGTEAEKASKSSSAAEQRRERARAIRQDIVDQVGSLIGDPSHEWVADQWWYYATLAEAHFGLQNYDEATQWIRDGQSAAGQIFEWELETCARQLATLARLQNEDQLQGEDFAFSPAWAALEKAFGTDAVPRTAFIGKIGLALSGGGFRAALYHLGVLARLAELDVLRNVEVLSCVSGGSILGAHYYLKVRHLLHNKTEEEITRQDYLQIVHEMIDEFLIGVQRNIRTRVAVNPLKNLKMFLSKGYSRTTRAAELYEQHLFSRVKDGGEEDHRWLNGLTIAPLTKTANGEVHNDDNFAPKYQNWRRDAKVPILVLNAATLNTGHSWQFTASWMGEAPAGIDAEIDGNERLRRMYYQEAPKEFQQIRLGEAVGASAAVPGLFEPLSFDNLYPDRIIRLVDGGVCDNQGVASLLEQDCRVLLVSDASGQMESQAATSRSIFGVLLRTNSIFQARIREAEYHDLKGRRRSGLLRGFMFVHLKGDLEVDPIDWIGCLDPYDASDDARPPSRRGPLTSYGIAKDIQELLSGIRTDLDSFSEAEAYALMTSAYRMTEYQFKYQKCVEGFAAPAQDETWKFLEIEKSMKGSGESYEYLKKLLEAGSSLAFKVWQIDPLLKTARRIALVILLGLLAASVYWWWEAPLPAFISQRGSGFLTNLADLFSSLTLRKVFLTVAGLFTGSLLLMILSLVLGDVLAQNVVSAVRWKDTARRVALAAFISTFGFVAAVLHLYIFDKRFLSVSSMRVLKQKGKT